MATLPHPANPAEPLQQPHALRRILQLLLAAAGWALFAWWWWIVLGRTAPREMRWTGVFLAIALGVIVLVTVLWVAHNVALARRRGARRSPREVSQDTSSDVLGRPVRVEPSARDLRNAPVVQVVVEGFTKVYRTGGLRGTIERRLAGVVQGGAEGERK